MARAIGRDRVQRLIAAGAQLVDVLPEDEYARTHIRGAINVPLKELTPERAARLDRTRPVIVYCSDFR